MGANRVRVGKDKADLVKALTLGNDTTGPFQTYADAIAFAAALGVKRKKRVVLQEVSKKEPGAIAQEIFISRGYDRLIKLLAIADKKDINIISPNDAEAEETRIAIFEEYANGGLEILQEELRGAVDYTERLLLIMIAERDQQSQPEGEFNLSRFL